MNFIWILEDQTWNWFEKNSLENNKPHYSLRATTSWPKSLAGLGCKLNTGDPCAIVLGQRRHSNLVVGNAGCGGSLRGEDSILRSWSGVSSPKYAVHSGARRPKGLVGERLEESSPAEMDRSGSTMESRQSSGTWIWHWIVAGGDWRRGGAQWRMAQTGTIMERVGRGSSARLVWLARCACMRRSPREGWPNQRTTGMARWRCNNLFFTKE
jgi:hypothetical protein